MRGVSVVLTHTQKTGEGLKFAEPHKWVQFWSWETCGNEVKMYFFFFLWGRLFVKARGRVTRQSKADGQAVI